MICLITSDRCQNKVFCKCNCWKLGNLLYQQPQVGFWTNNSKHSNNVFNSLPETKLSVNNVHIQLLLHNLKVSVAIPLMRYTYIVEKNVALDMAPSKFFRSIRWLKSFKSTFRNAVELSFGKHLLFTNVWTSAVLMFIGDIAQQEIEYQRHMLPVMFIVLGYINILFAGRMTVVGIIYGPLHHYFYDGIYRLWPERTFSNIGKKILADQFVMTPATIVILFYCAGLMEGKTWKGCTDEMTDNWVEVYTVDWCVWPPTQFVNFYYFPVKYQVLFINFVTMLYNLFLSYVKHREVALQHLKNYKTTISKEKFAKVK